MRPFMPHRVVPTQAPIRIRSLLGNIPKGQLTKGKGKGVGKESRKATRFQKVGKYTSKLEGAFREWERLVEEFSQDKYGEEEWPRELQLGYQRLQKVYRRHPFDHEPADEERMRQATATFRRGQSRIFKAYNEFDKQKEIFRQMYEEQQAQQQPEELIDVEMGEGEEEGGDDRGIFADREKAAQYFEQLRAFSEDERTRPQDITPREMKLIALNIRNLKRLTEREPDDPNYAARLEIIDVMERYFKRIKIRRGELPDPDAPQQPVPPQSRKGKEPMGKAGAAPPQPPPQGQQPQGQQPQGQQPQGQSPANDANFQVPERMAEGIRNEEGAPVRVDRKGKGKAPEPVPEPVIRPPKSPIRRDPQQMQELLEKLAQGKDPGGPSGGDPLLDDIKREMQEQLFEVTGKDIEEEEEERWGGEALIADYDYEPEPEVQRMPQGQGGAGPQIPQGQGPRAPQAPPAAGPRVAAGGAQPNAVGVEERQYNKEMAAQFNAERQAMYDQAAANPQSMPDLNARVQVPREIRRATALPQVTNTYHGPYDRGTLQPYTNLAEMGYQGVGGLHVYTGMTAAQVNRANVKRKRQGYILYDDVAKEWTHIKKKDIPTRGGQLTPVIEQAIKKRKISEDAGGPLTGWEHDMRKEKSFQQSRSAMDHANTQQPGDLQPKRR